MLNFFNVSYFWLNAIFNSNKSKFLYLASLQHLSKFLPIFLSRTDFGFSLKNNNFFYFFFLFKKHMYFRYTTLSDIICLDLLRTTNRFSIYYYVSSFVSTNRIFFNLWLNELSYIPSLSFLYKSAIWYEREVWDLFGVFFQKNQDMRRILTDYGFVGHPLRKDFPLSGFVELFFDDWQKKLIYEKVSFAQEYRMFNFENPWRQKRPISL